MNISGFLVVPDLTCTMCVRNFACHVVNDDTFDYVLKDMRIGDIIVFESTFQLTSTIYDVVSATSNECPHVLAGDKIKQKNTT